ncbi:uncharacterized protein RAG0_07046 [Rhynchosporium agropyri]|uniref:Altered inheritance of mitochondria protein 11 n=1 Tax=Rhynchosporium agropyri TaxID=914238 RepID=A0A1E1KJP3_9HELO|nr:uncharacterized protein RAG0_07046 [Rhynchosporium agropyri]
MADRASTPAAPAPTAPAAATTSESQSGFFSQRSRRQLGLFAAGASFFLLSSVITRRSIVRRKAMSVPLFFHHSNYSNPNINGALEAFEALTLATMNVFSYGIMFTGGFMWAFDISTVDDMKKKVRVDLNVKASQIDRDAEAEFEELFASVLDRKEFKALRGEKGIKTKEEKEQEAKEQEEQKPKP